MMPPPQVAQACILSATNGSQFHRFSLKLTMPPKDSTKAQLLEGRANLRRMIQEIPLTDEEMSAVEDGIAALDNLTDKLADTPTPDGRTPKQLVQITRQRN
jgi:hypothetical protein